MRAIIIHRDQGQRCVETVEALRAQRDVTIDIVIVDNASGPDEVAILEGIADVRIVHSGANLGFGGGANVGLREWLAEDAGEWTVVLPHDARPAPDCLARMLDAVATRPDAGLVSAEYGTDEIPAIDKVFGAVTVPAPRGAGFESADYAHGTFLMLRRSCLQQAGVFDESYFAYCEEADLALRARAFGWRSGIVWGAVVDNPHQGSPAAVVDYLMVRNTIVLVARHFGRYNACVRFAIAAVSTPWLALRRGRRSPWFDARARGWALLDLVRGRLGPPPIALLSG